MDEIDGELRNDLKQLIQQARVARLKKRRTPVPVEAEPAEPPAEDGPPDEERAALEAMLEE